MDYYKNKFIKYKMKYLNLQNGGHPFSTFRFMINSSISPIEDISNHFAPKFHIKPDSGKLADKILGITVRKEFPEEHTKLLNIIREKNINIKEIVKLHEVINK